MKHRYLGEAWSHLLPVPSSPKRKARVKRKARAKLRAWVKRMARVKRGDVTFSFHPTRVELKGASPRFTNLHYSCAYAMIAADHI